MIKLLLDPQIFNAQKFGGISRYHAEVCNHLVDKDDVQITCPTLCTENQHFINSRMYPQSYQKKNKFRIAFSKIFQAYRPENLLRKNSRYISDQLDLQDFDLFVTTYYDPYFLSHLQDKPFVLTIHDMIYELFPNYFADSQHIARNKRLLMNKAAKIIAVSENTKADILKIYPDIPASKIHVIYLASDIDGTSSRSVSLPARYLLFVGNRSGYKNFSILLKSIASTLSHHQNLHLICAGGNVFDENELRLIRQLGVQNQVTHRKFTEAELPAYYKNAICFVFPSEYEGFGIPVLEAMTCSCPVILSRHSSFPEVAGDAGVYFKPDDPIDLANKISLLLNNESIRQEYISKGLIQSEKFSWKKSAEQTLLVYREACTLIPGF
jgi:glycosyltransferase involved in cell wall biosynthesis